ncbi:hypothetical protein JVU11DRAFT_3583 [Chiua virens]|nr:hypothetical protein JVU11DRAFT_3583 [Chiua virens]
MPPVEDVELFQRLRATNDQDMANGIYAWACRRCKKSTSGIPRATSGGSSGPVSSASLDDKKCLTSGDSPAVKGTLPVSVASVVRPGVKVEPSTLVAALNDRETSDGKESVDEALVERTLMDKRETMSARKLPNVQAQPSPTKSGDVDVDMLTPQEEKKPLQNISKLPSHPDSGARMVASVDTIQDISKTLIRRTSGARKVVGTATVQNPPKKLSHQISGARKVAAPLTYSVDNVEMTDDAMITTFSEATGPSLQAPQTSSDNQLVGLKSTPDVQPGARVASSSSKREQEVRPVDEVAIQPQGNQDVGDDPEDLYGPPVERRVVRILPSLAEELREQQRRAALQKEEKLKRASLAPDWISAKYANDPLWKEVQIPNERRRPRKGAARELGESGLNVNELVGYFTAADWIREHVDKV